MDVDVDIDVDEDIHEDVDVDVVWSRQAAYPKSSRRCRSRCTNAT